MSTFTLVEAPQIPTSEVKALEKHIREAILDTDYILVTNYEMQFTVIEKLPFQMLVVNANGVPYSEVLDLRKRVEVALAAEKAEDKFVVLNYECLIYSMPQNPSHAESYGGIADPEPEETKLGHEEVEALIRNTFAELMEEKDAGETEEPDEED